MLKAAASVPVRLQVMVLFGGVVSGSPATAWYTTVLVGAFSATLAAVPEVIVGASLTSAMARWKLCDASGAAWLPAVVSLALTVTSYAAFASKLAPPLKCSSGPLMPVTIEKKVASAPDSDRVLVPSASSVMAMSATLTSPPQAGYPSAGDLHRR